MKQRVTNKANTGDKKESQKFLIKKKVGIKENKEQDQMGQIKTRQQGYRFKPKKINNFMKYKWSKHPKIVSLGKKARPNYMLSIRIPL